MIQYLPILFIIRATVLYCIVPIKLLSARQRISGAFTVLVMKGIILHVNNPRGLK